MSNGYRVAFVNDSLGSGRARMWVNVSREVVSEAQAIKWMRHFKRRGYNAWVETADGTHYPVKGAKRAFKTDAKREMIHFTAQ